MRTHTGGEDIQILKIFPRDHGSRSNYKVSRRANAIPWAIELRRWNIQMWNIENALNPGVTDSNKKSTICGVEIGRFGEISRRQAREYGLWYHSCTEQLRHTIMYHVSCIMYHVSCIMYHARNLSRIPDVRDDFRGFSRRMFCPPVATAIGPYFMRVFGPRKRNDLTFKWTLQRRMNSACCLLERISTSECQARNDSTWKWTLRRPRDCATSALDRQLGNSGVHGNNSRKFMSHSTGTILFSRSFEKPQPNRPSLWRFLSQNICCLWLSPYSISINILDCKSFREIHFYLRYHKARRLLLAGGMVLLCDRTLESFFSSEL
jgi:hypothetical protein